MLKVFVSWSGGKDSTLAAFKASKDGEIVGLLNLVREDGRSYHGLTGELIAKQAEAMEIPIFQRRTSWDDYEENFKSAVTDLKELGVEAGVFGDIDIQEHREWVERVCKELDIKPILPLWNRERDEIISEFIKSGFEALVVATDAKYLGKEALGRAIDYDFIDYLRKHDVDICGEAGEYHTFVTGGPLFTKTVRIDEADKILRDGHWFLDITTIGSGK